MGEGCTCEVEGQPADEDGEEGYSFEVFEEGCQEGILTEAVAEDNEDCVGGGGLVSLYG